MKSSLLQVRHVSGRSLAGVLELGRSGQINLGRASSDWGGEFPQKGWPKEKWKVLGCAKALMARGTRHSCPRCSLGYKVWCPSSIRRADFGAGVLHLPVPVSSSAKGGERPESHLPWQPCWEVEVHPAGVTTPGQVKLHLWESGHLAYCSLLLLHRLTDLCHGPASVKLCKGYVKPSPSSGLQ